MPRWTEPPRPTKPPAPAGAWERLYAVRERHPKLVVFAAAKLLRTYQQPRGAQREAIWLLSEIGASMRYGSPVPAALYPHDPLPTHALANAYSAYLAARKADST